MPRTVTARFESEEEAERALSAIAAEVPLRDSAVIGSGLPGSLVLDTLQLSPEDRASCEEMLAKGGFLLVAQVATESRGDAVMRLLDGRLHGSEVSSAGGVPTEERLSGVEERQNGVATVTHEAVSLPMTEAGQAPHTEALAPNPVAAPNVGAAPVEEVAEERIPLVEEELRIGKREVVRGRSRIHTFVVDVPVQEQVELIHEETHLERRPVNRRLSEEEVASAGLLQERVIEIAEMREEPVVTKEAFVREELVVTKTLHRRVEQIQESVRRTEVETERLEADEGARPGTSAEERV